MAQLKDTNLTGNYIKIPTGTRSNRPDTISRVSGLYDDILRPATNGMQLTISSGTNWEKYQNLPSYLKNLPSTTCINDTDSVSWTIPACKVYMLRQTSWNAVSTTGWTTVETGKNYITGQSSVAVYSKEFSAGTYTFDNNSAMYLFETAEKGTMRWNTDYNEFEVFNGYDWLTESMTPGLPVTRGMHSLWDAGDDFTQGAYNSDFMSCLDRTSSQVHIYHSNSSAYQAANNDIRVRIDDVLCWDCNSSSYYMRDQGTTVTFGPRHTLWCWAWARSSTSGWRTLWRGNNDHPIIIQSGTDNIGFYDNQTAGYFRDTGSDITGLTETWRMWTLTADGSGNSEIYLDDASVGTVDRSTAGDTFDIFGNYTSGQHFGYVAMAAIYNTDLSADEVKKSFDATKHKFGRT